MSKVYYLLECEEEEYIIVRSVFCQRNSDDTFFCTTVSKSTFKGNKIFEGTARLCEAHASQKSLKAIVIDDDLLEPLTASNIPTNLRSPIYSPATTRVNFFIDLFSFNFGP